MDELNQKKSPAAAIVAVVALALIIGLGGYAYMKSKSAETTPPAATEETAPAPTAETTPPATEEKPPVVVETKKLDIAEPESPPPSASLTDPVVKAMMVPRTLGDANAPVKITEYSSLTCPHCGAFHRDTFEKFKSEFIDTNKVQITFKEFPLNQPALDASMILRCMPGDKYVNFMTLLFQEQEKWAYNEKYKDVLRQNAKLGGMTDKEFDDCLANNTLKEAIIGDMKAASDKYKVQSTPSFVIAGGKTLVGNQPLTAFEEAINGTSSTPAATDAAPAAAAPETPAAAPAAPAEEPKPVTDEPAPPAE